MPPTPLPPTPNAPFPPPAFDNNVPPPPPNAPTKPPPSVSVRPRFQGGLQVEYKPVEDGRTAIIVNGGVIIIIASTPDTPGAKTQFVDIEADRLVIWTKGNAQQLLSNMRTEQGADSGAHELYLSGHVAMRSRSDKDIKTLRANELYYDVRRNVAVAREADFEMQVQKAIFPIHVLTPELQQLNSKMFQTKDAVIHSSTLPSDPGLTVSITDMTIEERQYELSYLYGLWPAYDKDGKRKIQTDHVFTGINYITYIEGVPVFYFPYFRGRVEDPLGPLDAVNASYNRIFGFQINTTWDIYDILDLPHFDGTKWRSSISTILRCAAPALARYSTSAAKTSSASATLTRANSKPMACSITARTSSAAIAAMSPSGPIFRNLLADRPSRLPRLDLWQSQRPGPTRRLQLPRPVRVPQRSQLPGTVLPQQPSERRQPGHLRLPQATEEQLGLDARRRHQHQSTGSRTPTGCPRPTGTCSARRSWTTCSSSTRTPAPPTLSSGRPIACRSRICRPTSRADTARFDLDVGHQHAAFNLGPFKFAPYLTFDLADYTQNINGDNQGRVYGGGGVRWNLPLSKLYPDIQSELFNINEIYHKINFYGNYFNAQSSSSFTTLPQLDRLNDDVTDQALRDIRPLQSLYNPANAAFLTSSNLFNPQYYALRRLVTNSPDENDSIQVVQLGLDPRWQTKRGFPGNEHVVDWMSLNLQATVFPQADRDNLGHTFGVVEYNWVWNIGDRTALTSNGALRAVPRWSARPSTSAPILGRPVDTNFYLGYRLIDPMESKAIFASISYPFSSKYALTDRTVWDFGVNVSSYSFFAVAHGHRPSGQPRPQLQLDAEHRRRHLRDASQRRVPLQPGRQPLSWQPSSKPRSDLQSEMTSEIPIR